MPDFGLGFWVLACANVCYLLYMSKKNKSDNYRIEEIEDELSSVRVNVENTMDRVDVAEGSLETLSRETKIDIGSVTNNVDKMIENQTKIDRSTIDRTNFGGEQAIQ